MLIHDVELSDQLCDVLARGASTWTAEESTQVWELISAYGRDKIKLVMEKIRGGEKPSNDAEAEELPLQINNTPQDQVVDEPPAEQLQTSEPLINPEITT